MPATLEASRSAGYYVLVQLNEGKGEKIVYSVRSVEHLHVAFTTRDGGLVAERVPMTARSEGSQESLAGGRVDGGHCWLKPELTRERAVHAA